MIIPSKKVSVLQYYIGWSFMGKELRIKANYGTFCIDKMPLLFNEKALELFNDALTDRRMDLMPKVLRPRQSPVWELTNDPTEDAMLILNRNTVERGSQNKTAVKRKAE